MLVPLEARSGVVPPAVDHDPGPVFASGSADSRYQRNRPAIVGERMCRLLLLLDAPQQLDHGPEEAIGEP